VFVEEPSVSGCHGLGITFPWGRPLRAHIRSESCFLLILVWAKCSLVWAVTWCFKKGSLFSMVSKSLKYLFSLSALCVAMVIGFGSTGIKLSDLCDVFGLGHIAEHIVLG